MKDTNLMAATSIVHVIVDYLSKYFAKEAFGNDITNFDPSKYNETYDTCYYHICGIEFADYYRSIANSVNRNVTPAQLCSIDYLLNKFINYKFNLCNAGMEIIV